MSCHCLFSSPYIADEKYKDISQLFTKEGAIYLLKNDHKFSREITIPRNSEIVFEGGSLCGPIIFNDTKLSGSVRLQGSRLGGTIINSIFEADWLCYKDGKQDDAININNIIEICGSIHFGAGIYRLTSKFIPPHDMIDKYRNMISSHIGIHKSNVTLRGEFGTIFVTKEPYGMICAYSKPNNIDNSISNIKIESIQFHTENDGKTFHQVQHTIKCNGINGFIVKDCIIDDFWGDAICLCHYGDHPGTGEMIRNQNIIIIKNTIKGGEHHNTRNGIAVINGKNVTIEGNIIMNTTKAGMPGAIDIEANNSAFTIDNIRVVNNTIEGCMGTAGGICVNANDRQGPAHNIYIIGNTIRNCYCGLAFVVNSDNTSDSYIIKDNIVDIDTPPYLFIGSGKSSNWMITGNIFKRLSSTKIPGNIKVDGLVVENNTFGFIRW